VEKVKSGKGPTGGSKEEKCGHFSTAAVKRGKKLFLLLQLKIGRERKKAASKNGWLDENGKRSRQLGQEERKTGKKKPGGVEGSAGGNRRHNYGRMPGKGIRSVMPPAE